MTSLINMEYSRVNCNYLLFSGRDGIPYKASSNYFQVMKKPDWSLLQYRVDFAPDIEHMFVRKAMIRQHENMIGKYIFDGTLLYCTKRHKQVSVN